MKLLIIEADFGFGLKMEGSSVDKSKAGGTSTVSSFIFHYYFVIICV